ncbi:TPA: ATPase RavA domain-containing protein [Salmonella enterica subsp. enterica serovar Newport]
MPPQYLPTEKFFSLICKLEKDSYEYDYIIRLCLLSALSGGSMFLLNPPDAVRNLIIHRLKFIFQHARVFKYTMSKHTSRKDIFGSFPIRMSKSEVYHKHVTANYFPQAEIIFLDDIWKTDPSLLNPLFSAIKKQCYYNGSVQEKIPMRLLVVASDELPEDNCVLEPLYNCLLIRVWPERVHYKYENIICCTPGKRLNESDSLIPVALQVTDEEYNQWQKDISLIVIPDHVFEFIFRLRQQIDDISHAPYVSDRQWKKVVHLLQASAFFCGRNSVSTIDLILLKECLWTDFNSMKIIENQLFIIMTELAWQQKSMLAEFDSTIQQCIQFQQKNSTARFTVHCKNSESDDHPYYLPVGLQTESPVLTLLLHHPLYMNSMDVTHITFERKVLVQWLEKGDEIRGWLNGKCAQQLKIAVDNSLYLVIYNERMQSTRLSQLLSKENFHRDIKKKLDTLENKWLKQYSNFRKQQEKGLFISSDWLSLIENSLQDVNIQLHRI